MVYLRVSGVAVCEVFGGGGTGSSTPSEKWVPVFER